MINKTKKFKRRETLAISDTKSRLKNYFMRNPINQGNYFKTQTLDKEIDLMSDIFQEKKNRMGDSSALISMFQERHKKLKNSLFGFDLGKSFASMNNIALAYFIE